MGTPHPFRFLLASSWLKPSIAVLKQTRKQKWYVQGMIIRDIIKGDSWLVLNVLFLNLLSPTQCRYIHDLEDINQFLEYTLLTSGSFSFLLYVCIIRL